jgi:hypothetical protein
LITIANPDDHPLTWRIEQKKLPSVIFEKNRLQSFGTALLAVGEYIYIYGTEEDRNAKPSRRFLVVARVPPHQIGDFSQWRFYRDGEWTSDHRQASRSVEGMATEGSVTYLSKREIYTLVYTDRGLSDRIVARTATHPWGPWSAPIELYKCPEMDRDKKLFCYSGKAHAALSSDDVLVVSYSVNSFDFWQVARDSNLYWPRFVRIRLGNFH